jgi:hypothetical protein
MQAGTGPSRAGNVIVGRMAEYRVQGQCELCAEGVGAAPLMPASSSRLRFSLQPQPFVGAPLRFFAGDSIALLKFAD